VCRGEGVSHSHGGPFARALAARRPDRVSHPISMGADLQGMFGASTPTLFAVSIARRVVYASGRARRETCLTGHCGCPFSHDFARPFPFEDVRPPASTQKATASCTGNAK
jgi:pimeloyl-ACP methyl ester carboxylesterase